MTVLWRWAADAGVQIADLAGAAWGAVGVLGALTGRERTGGRTSTFDDRRGARVLAAELGNMDAARATDPRDRDADGGLACYGSTRPDGLYMSRGLEPSSTWPSTR